jgi:WD40 repeat protein
VTASDDKTAKVWDANTGQELFTLKGHDGAVWSASPDGKRIATAGLDGIVQIYTTDMEELLQIAESRVTRQLTAEEKDKYGVLDLN